VLNVFNDSASGIIYLAKKDGISLLAGLAHPLNRKLLIFPITLVGRAQLVIVLILLYAITTDKHIIGSVGLR
jgi:hypothetical protein